MIHQPPFLLLTDSANATNFTIIQTTNNEQPADADNLYGGFNLGTHVGDELNKVHRNRSMLLAHLQQIQPMIERIEWLNQVHGNEVYHVTEKLNSQSVNADAHITTLDNIALAIMTADCVPIVIASTDGDIIGAVHAGWQGLAKSVIDNTVQKMAHQISMQKPDLSITELRYVTQDWQAWIGACIAQDNYEVDGRVRTNVLATLDVNQVIADTLFRPNETKAGHYFADLAKVAEWQLNRCGIKNVIQSGLDSYSDERFYSYRQQTQQQLASTGRMATLIFRH